MWNSNAFTWTKVTCFQSLEKVTALRATPQRYMWAVFHDRLLPLCRDCSPSSALNSTIHKQAAQHAHALLERRVPEEKDGPRTRGEERAQISLSPGDIARRIQTAREAELSRALSCDGGAITTRWINTRVVKVKWCYVARCYWTWRVTLHDTDTLPHPHAPPAPSPLQVGLRLRPHNDLQKRVKCWEPLAIPATEPSLTVMICPGRCYWMCLWLQFYFFSRLNWPWYIIHIPAVLSF